MSRTSDLLGLIIDTATQPIDDDPGFDERGYTSLLVPEGSSPGEESEDDDAYEGLRESGLSPQEAQQTVDTMRPLSDDELEILKENPGLEGLTRVDDAERQAWLAEKAGQGNKAMDRAAEDAVYGEHNMNHDEEKMEQADTDSGWRLRRRRRRPPPPTDGQSVPDDAADPNAPPPDPSTTAPDASQGEPNMHGWNHIRTLTGKPDVTDSLGALATQILGTDRKTSWSNESSPDELMGTGQPAPGNRTNMLPAKDNPYADKIVRAITQKLKAGGPMSASELGLLSSAAREGNVNAQKLLVVLEARGVAVNADSSGLDPWMYKLNPSYWFSSHRKKEFIDEEKKAWVENARLQKRLAKQKDILDQAEKADQAIKAVAAAKEQSATTEAQLKEIEASFKTAMTGSFVGHEKIMPISEIVANALAKAGKREDAGKLYGKIRAGQSLDQDELKQARQIANLIGRMRVVHGDLVEDSGETTTMHGAFVGACVMGGIEAAQTLTAKHQQFAETIAKKLAANQELSTAERNGLAKVLQDQAKLHKFTTSLVSGRAFIGCPKQKAWTHGAFVGAVKSMSDPDKKMLSAIVKLAKIGNPRAQKALSTLRQSGEIMGGSPTLRSCFRYATAPIRLPSQESTSGGRLFKRRRPSPEENRLNIMKEAAAKQKKAEEAATAAQAEADAEQRAQQAIANAADAEAAAAEAAAEAKRQKTATAEARVNPNLIPTADDADAASPQADSSGSTPRPIPGTFVGATEAELEQLRKKSSVPGSSIKPQHIKILAKANEESPTGIKIRAGANTYLGSQHPDPKIRMPADRAIKIMAAKAKKGDLQAQRDLTAVKAGRIAVRTKAKLVKEQYPGQQKDALYWKRHFAAEARNQKREKILAARTARKAKVVAFQKRYENALGDKLAQASRRKQLRQHAVVVKRAQKGDPRAKAYIAKNLAASKRGDKKALVNVQSMRLAKRVQDHVTTKREARNVRAATKMAHRILKGDKKATRQYMVLKDAADRGNPNAKRAMERLALGGALAATITTGMVVVPKLAFKPKRVKTLKPGTLGYKRAQAQLASIQKKIRGGTATQAEIGAAANLAMQMGKMDTARFLANLNDTSLQAAKQQVASAQSKAASSTGTREELTAGARVANQLGDQEAAGALAQKAASAPSSTEKLKQVGNTVAAAQAGNPAAQATLDKALEGAKAGNVDDIQTLGHVMAVKTIDAANKGEPISPTMADAINTQARAQAGSLPDQETLARVSEAATKPNPTPEAVLAASGAVGAAALGTTLATRPQARKELMAKVNPPIPAGEKTAAEAEVAECVAKANEGTITPQEGARGVVLAQRLGKPKLAAEIAAKSPPYDEPWGKELSSMPNEPLPPITGARELVRESIRALTFSTRDPLANWREGVTGQAVGGAPPQMVTITSAGWSPFSIFKQPSKASWAAMFVPGAAPIIATAAMANKAKGAMSRPSGKGGGKQPPETPEETKPTETIVGSDDFKELIAAALKSKKMSKADFNKAINVSAGPEAAPFAKKALGEQTLKFLQSKNVTVGGTSVGNADEFKQLIVAAVKSKAMSKDDFNRAIKAHVKADATREERMAAGKKMLKFLGAKGVKIG